jgi:four helix bundle protein
MQDFKKLKVWEKAHFNAIEIYKLTRMFSKEEIYGLTSQIRRSAVSVVANIAEGCGKYSDKDFARYLSISLGSLNETEYYAILSKDLNLVSEEKVNHLSENLYEVKSMLVALIKKVRQADITK